MKKEMCKRCPERYCCRGICREMNDLIIQKRKENANGKGLSNT